jgi:uncharacterized membrane protein
LKKEFHPNLFNLKKAGKRMKLKTKYLVISALMIISTIMSGILAFMPLEEACGIAGEGGSCIVVQTSKYESTFGIKNSFFGLIAFPILAILSAIESKKPKKHQKKMIKIGLILSSIVAIYFLYIQFFVLNAICKYCMVVDIAILISLAILIFNKK